MKLIRSLRLQRQQKPLLLCEIQLFELAEQGYLVNLRQWREGQEGRDTTRTPQPVSLARAQQLFQACQIERQAQGFLPLEQDSAASPLNATVLAASAVKPSTAATSTPTSTLATAPSDQILLERLQAAHWQKLNPKQRSRLIWRIGERRLSRAVPLLVSLLGQGTSLQDYSLAYAIGRAGDGGALQAMHELQKRSSNLSVQRMAQQAWWQLASSEQKQQAAQSLIEQWPRKVREAWQTQEENTVLAAFLLAEQHRSLRLEQSLPQLDLIAHAELPEAPLARRIVLVQAETLAILPGAFRALRYLYKAAEMRGDAMQWGILAQRFETATALNRGGTGHLWLDRRWVPYRQEAQSDNSRVAYSKFTRDYLRRRSWRTLRRLAQDDPSAYVAMATSALLAMDDAQAKAASNRTFATRLGPQTRYYGPYSHWLLLNRLLHSNSPWRSSRDGGSWYQISPIASVDTLDTKRARQEAFPACWDQAPNAAAMLLQLLLASRCAAVHQFAARALLDHPQFCATLDVSVLGQLLASPYLSTCEWAFHCCQQRIHAEQIESDVLLALLQSRLPAARQFAFDCISRAPERYATDAFLVANMLCAFDASVRGQGRLLCLLTRSDAQQAQATVLCLLEWLENCVEWEQENAALAEMFADLVPVLGGALKDAAQQAPYARLLQLINVEVQAASAAAPAFQVAAVAAHWLALHQEPASSVPAALLTRLLRAENALLHSAGVTLFAALPDSVLLAQVEILASFCTSPHAAARQSVRAALARLSRTAPEFAMQIMPHLLDSLFRAESAEGLHQDVLQCLRGPLQAALAQLDAATTLRLLQARSKAAQELGSSVLPRYSVTDFSVKQWAQLAGHEVASVRQWAQAAYHAHPAIVLANLTDALRIFDSRWQDSVDFASAFFRQHGTQQDWTPTLLVSLCDHFSPQVQAFGREMLSTHFSVNDVDFYLQSLSQHPASNMQLFVSSWLESAAAGNLDVLQQLEPYFINVLSQVNRARSVKDRILAFLQGQIAVSPEIAAFVGHIFARQVVGIAIGDRAHYIAGLHAIAQRYPQLPALTTASFSIAKVAKVANTVRTGDAA